MVKGATFYLQITYRFVRLKSNMETNVFLSYLANDLFWFGWVFYPSNEGGLACGKLSSGLSGF